MTIDYKALAAKAAKRSNHDETQESFDFEPAAEGKTLGRLIEYIEVGKQKRKAYKGQPKKPADGVRITFELLGKKYVKEIEVDGKKKLIADRITIPMTLSLSDKANFKKTYDKMKYGRDDVHHMAQMLDEAFVITIKHNKSEDGKKTYANVDNIEAPRSEDPETGEVKVLKARKAISPLKMFIFDEPTQETWDSIFIDGSNEKKGDDGKTVSVSKNFIQNMIKKATNFQGSALEQMLGGIDDLPEFEEELDDELPEEAPKKKAPTKKKAKKAEPVEVDQADGLDLDELDEIAF